MKNRKLLIAVGGIAALAGLVLSGIRPAAAAKTAAELEKEKAQANPYPNDFGPDHLSEDVLSTYPADRQEGYKLLLVRCAQCHTPSRPLNSRFVEPAVGLDYVGKPDQTPKEKAAVAKLKAEHPEYFGEASSGVWQIEDGVWNRYVKRMLNKPGCGVAAGGHMTVPEAKKIYMFLVYDGERRKLGANAETWKAHRLKLIQTLKEKNPSRYEELKKDNDL